MPVQKVHSLLMPVNELTEVTITPFSYQQDKAMVKKATPEDKKEPDEDMLAMLRFEQATGLSEDDKDNLSQPDINTLEHWLNVYLLSESDKVAKLLKLTVDDKPWCIGKGMTVNLLQPLPDGTDSYTLKYPTGKTTKRFNSYDDASDRSEYISSACTSLIDEQVMMLSTPDWTTLQRRLTNFLAQKADFFLP